MEVFWTLGYEGTTMLDLQKAMGGLTAPSFYAAFGSKEQAFKEAIALHADTIGAKALQGLAGGSTAKAAVEGMLRAAIDAFSQPGKPRGCMLTLGAVNCTRANGKIQEYIREMRLRGLKFIRKRIQQGIADGDVPAGTEVNALVSLIAVIQAGLSMRARDGASRNELQTVVDCAMLSWDQMVGKRKSRGRAVKPGK